MFPPAFSFALAGLGAFVLLAWREIFVSTNQREQNHTIGSRSHISPCFVFAGCARLIDSDSEHAQHPQAQKGLVHPHHLHNNLRTLTMEDQSHNNASVSAQAASGDHREKRQRHGEQENADDADVMLALALQEEEYNLYQDVWNLEEEIPDAPAEIAEQTGTEFGDEARLVQTPVGLAWKLVERFVLLWEALPAWSANISLVSRDDMVATAENLVLLQQEWKLLASTNARPWTVDVAFHWTRLENLESIREGGLLTKTERDASGIQARYHGSSYGNGVYTAR